MAMWEVVEVALGPSTYRGRFRVEGGRLVLEWGGGRVTEWLGMLKPDIVATMLLKKLATWMAAAAA